MLKMNKQRHLGQTSKKYDFVTKTMYDKGRNIDGRTRANLLINRSCNVSPDLKDAEQLTDYEGNYLNFEENRKQQRFLDQNDSQRLSRETINFIRDLKKILYDDLSKDIKSSPRAIPNDLQGTLIETKLNDNDSANEIYELINSEEVINQPTEGKSKRLSSPKNVRISDEPRIKVIAEKFNRYKKNNVEVRKLEERVVCIEYDVYDRDTECNVEPAQRLRAYFSVKAVYENDDVIPVISSSVKRDYGITDEDFKNHSSDKGIEVIDAKIPENKPYLEDLRSVLKRKQVIDCKKNKTFLDPINLYQMAERDSVYLNGAYSYTNFLSNAELDEIKDLIMKKTTSSVEGISRRKLRAKKDVTTGKETEDSVEKKTMIEQLFKN